MWLSQRKHGVVPGCLEGLGSQRAGSLLPVLREAGKPGDQHAKKKVAVVRGAESALCESPPLWLGGIARSQASVFPGSRGLGSSDISTRSGPVEGGEVRERGLH